MANTLVHDELGRQGRGLSRREFIKGVGAIVAGGVLLAIGGQLIATGRLPEVPGEALQRTTFARLLGETFRVYQESGAMPALRLAKVRDLRAPARQAAPPSAQRERSFSLLFTGPIDPMIDQGTYRFEHDRLGSFSLFIVPLVPERGAHYYEAIFNRL
jgi:hypothetical protein